MASDEDKELAEAIRRVEDHVREGNHKLELSLASVIAALKAIAARLEAMGSPGGLSKPDLYYKLGVVLAAGIAAFFGIRSG